MRVKCKSVGIPSRVDADAFGSHKITFCFACSAPRSLNFQILRASLIRQSGYARARARHAFHALVHAIPDHSFFSLTIHEHAIDPNGSAPSSTTTTPSIMNDDNAQAENSDEEALLEILGLSSLNCLEDASSAEQHDSFENTSSHPQQVQERIERTQLSTNGIPQLSSSQIQTIIEDLGLQTIYKHDQVVVFPGTLSIPAHVMRRLSDEIIWGSGSAVPLCGGNGTSRKGMQCDRTYETIRTVRRQRRKNKSDDEEIDGVKERKETKAEAEDQIEAAEEAETEYEVEERRVLTRLENFVPHHAGWSELCLGYLPKLISALWGQEMVLYKEKLNIKPPGGSGFAPHLDSPSLRVALGDDGPKKFVTVMVAIDDMTVSNGCLRVVKGPSSETFHVPVILPSGDNPDGDGRAGAIPDDIAADLDFEDIVVKGGTIAAFGGYVPHRSAANGSSFSRRAVFLTYNPATEGSCREKYYDKMKAMRDVWRDKVGLGGSRQLSEDEQMELDALASIPKI